MEGLTGIIKHGSIRATNALYLNDASEIIHGLDLFEMCVEERRSATDNTMTTPFEPGFLKAAFGNLPV